MTHSSEALNFVLVDFKGGATFASLDALPHTCAVITNLADELPLVDRMQDALAGELVRRQELLRAAGNYASLHEYERARAAGEPLAPLPSLLIICDEFSELLAAKPDFIDLFVLIGRLGRSLGVHLLLATQRLEEGRLRGLETHLSYRIGLRTFSAMESRIVLGVPDAYELPARPGTATSRSAPQTLLRFRAAYVSGPYRPAGRRPAPSQAVGAAARIVPYGTGPPCPSPDARRPTAAPEAAGRAGGRPADHHARRDRRPAARPGPAGAPGLAAAAGRAAQPGPSCSARWPSTRARGLRGRRPGAATARLAVPVGIVDKPFEQRRDLLVVGPGRRGRQRRHRRRPAAGKSTLLRTLICALALTHTPARGAVLLPGLRRRRAARRSTGCRTCAAWPAGATPRRCAGPSPRCAALLAEREARFAELGIDSMAAYRRPAGRAARSPTTRSATCSWSSTAGSRCAQEYEELEPTHHRPRQPRASATASTSC